MAREATRQEDLRGGPFYVRETTPDQLDIALDGQPIARVPLAGVKSFVATYKEKLECLVPEARQLRAEPFNLSGRTLEVSQPGEPAVRVPLSRLLNVAEKIENWEKSAA